MNTPPSAGNKLPAFAPELIEKEIAHLRKRTGTRNAAETTRAWSKLLIFLGVLGVFWLWGMDTVLFSYNRGDAVHVYLYLHNYGSDAKAQALADSGLLTSAEVKQLNARAGSFQDYFSGTAAAERRNDQLLAYMQQMHALHQGDYAALSPMNKVRYYLFIKTGLVPPTRWNVLNSSIDP